ncbi:MAG: hypothetical protein ACI4QO_04105, partial [Clostridia bacterium]
MNQTRKIFVFLSFAAFCWVLVAGWAVVNGRLGSSVNPVYNNVYNVTALHADYTYDYEGETDAVPGEVWGAILPAPSADSAMTARTMADLSETLSSKLVLVIAFADNLGYNAVSSWYDWQTPFGIVQVDGNAISHLLEQGAVIDGEKVGETEELKEILPYFSCYLKDKRITPLVFDTAAGMDYVISFLDRLAAYHDGYGVLILTPAQNEKMPLFSEDTVLLEEAFDSSPDTDFGGALLPLECCELNAMKYILQNDGNHVLQVIGEGTEKGLSFDGISVFYGKEK